jgi:hypothetical protein
MAAEEEAVKVMDSLENVRGPALARGTAEALQRRAWHESQHWRICRSPTGA